MTTKFMKNFSLVAIKLECTNNIKENKYILTCEEDLNARNNCSSISEIRSL